MDVEETEEPHTGERGLDQGYDDAAGRRWNSQMVDVPISRFVKKSLK